MKKSKDRERRRSIIQTITGLFTSSKKDEAKKDEPKEAESNSKKSSPVKFQLPKFAPKKEKSSKVSYDFIFLKRHLVNLS